MSENTKGTVVKKTYNSPLFWVLAVLWFIYILIILPVGLLSGGDSDAAGNAMSQGLGFLFLTMPLSLIILIVNIAILIKENSSLKLKEIAVISSVIVTFLFLSNLF